MNFVKCIDNLHPYDVTNQLTMGKLYEVSRKTSTDIIILNDRNYTIGYVKERFIEIPDEEAVELIKFRQKEIVTEQGKLSGEYNKLTTSLLILEKKIEYKESIKLGSRWSAPNGNEYMVCSTGDGYILVNLRDGIRWSDPKKNIENVFGSSFHKFTKLP